MECNILLFLIVAPIYFLVKSCIRCTKDTVHFRLISKVLINKQQLNIQIHAGTPCDGHRIAYPLRTIAVVTLITFGGARRIDPQSLCGKRSRVELSPLYSVIQSGNDFVAAYYIIDLIVAVDQGRDAVSAPVYVYDLTRHGDCVGRGNKYIRGHFLDQHFLFGHSLGYVPMCIYSVVCPEPSYKTQLPAGDAAAYGYCLSIDLPIQVIGSRFFGIKAADLEPVFQIGKGSVTPEVTSAIEETFNTHELVKITVLKNCLDDVKEVAITVSERTRSDLVQVIGRKFVLYKPFKDEPKIILPKSKKNS